MFEVRIDDRELKRLERTVKSLGGNMGTVMSRALNRTASTARAEVSRSLAKRLGMKITTTKRYIYLRKASRSNWRATLDFSAKPLPLDVHDPKKTSRGLSVRTGRGRVLIRQAFFALGGWFTRLPKAGGFKMQVTVGEAYGIGDDALVPRLPIGRIKGPFLSAYFSSLGEVRAALHRESQQKLAKNIHDQVKLILQRRAG